MLLARYIFKQLSTFTFYSLLAFLSLYAFFDVLNESGKLGEGNYTFGVMMQYVAMLVPSHIYDLMPLAVLIGSLIALSQLASNSEYTVIKSSGISTKKIISWLLYFGIVCAIITLVLGEWVVPATENKAERLRVNAVQGRINANHYSGIWMKDGSKFINIREMLPDGTLKDINIYDVDDNNLTESVHIEQAQSIGNNNWQVNHLDSTTFLSENTEAKNIASNIWELNIDQSLLNVLLVDPEQMSMQDLNQYIQYLENSHQKTQRYHLAWWRKLFYPVASISMVLIALAFTPQQRRHGNMGLKLFAGIGLGIGFHFANRLFGFSSLLYGIPPFLAATLPTILFLMVATYWIYKKEKR